MNTRKDFMLNLEIFLFLAFVTLSVVHTTCDIIRWGGDWVNSRIVMNQPKVNIQDKYTVLLSATPMKPATKIETPKPTPEPEVYSLTESEIKLIAQVTMAEAEAEPELGQRLVIDSILNRVDGKYWPDTVSEVVNQPHQFTSEDNERFHRCYPREDLVELVKEELVKRTDNEIVFFRTGHYHSFGVPVQKVGSHYFSKYE